MELIELLAKTAIATLFDVAPIVVILVTFQFLVLRRQLPNLRRVIVGSIFVVLGLTLFLVGLEKALFPIGRTMARQLTSPEIIGRTADARWQDYVWVYVFATAIGFAATVAEPALIALALKAQEVSGGAIRARHLRLVVAVGFGLGVAVGALRIITGIPLPLYAIAGYAVIMLQTLRAPRSIVPLAYDSAPVTTTTVTVPLVTALGLGLASSIPGRSPIIDGFGLIAFAGLWPIMSVLAYASIAIRIQKPQRAARHEGS